MEGSQLLLWSAAIGAGAAFGTMLIALAALGVALRQIRSSREVEAQNAYEGYHHLSLQYPRYAYGAIDVAAADGAELDAYCLYVLSMLLTVERVLTLFPHDRHWRAALIDDVSRHRALLASEKFRPHKASLDPRVARLVDQAAQASG